MPCRPARADQVQRWLTFLRNHKDAIAAMDLFTVPTVSCRILYRFVVIKHGRRDVRHFNATFNPTAAWVIQQLREAFPYDTATRHLIFDRTHLGLGKDTPTGRPVTPRPSPMAEVVALPRVGGLHPRYEWRDAA